jgi:hypothetical protein
MKGAMPPERIEERIAGRRIKRRCREDNWEKRRRIEGVSVVVVVLVIGGGGGISIGEDFLKLKTVEKDRMRVHVHRAEFRGQRLRCRPQVPYLVLRGENESKNQRRTKISESTS